MQPLQREPYLLENRKGRFSRPIAAAPAVVRYQRPGVIAPPYALTGRCPRIGQNTINPSRLNSSNSRPFRVSLSGSIPPQPISVRMLSWVGVSAATPLKRTGLHERYADCV
jgi:hypothetical protein